MFKKGFAKIICTLFILLALIVILYSHNRKSEGIIIIEAHFMQYACGDENDDMRIEKVNSEKYKFLIGHDIDPHVFALKYGLKNYFFDNKTDEYGYTFRLKGYPSKDAQSGCDKAVPKFWVKEIERLDGSNRKTNWNFY